MTPQADVSVEFQKVWKLQYQGHDCMVVQGEGELEISEASLACGNTVT